VVDDPLPVVISDGAAGSVQMARVGLGVEEATVRSDTNGRRTQTAGSERRLSKGAAMDDTAAVGAVNENDRRRIGSRAVVIDRLTNRRFNIVRSYDNVNF
jgi:hypothetical protein